MSFLNTAINKLPFELHIPGYQFCGPGTKLQKRLKRGDKGINPLDAACREHDIAYLNSNDLTKRHEADNILAQKAGQRVIAKDSSAGEKASAAAVWLAMKAKTKMGAGILKKKKKKGVSKAKIGTIIKKKRMRKAKIGAITKKKRIPKSKIDALTKQNIKKKQKKIQKPKIDVVTKQNIKKKRIQKRKIGVVTKQNMKKKKKNIKRKRILPVAKRGGFLPVLPLLGAIGALAGGASGIVKAVNDSKAAAQQLQEMQRHNKMMEGRGLYLAPYKKGGDIS